MNSKYLVIIIALIAIIAVGLFVFSQNPISQEGNIGNKTFSIPDGYKIIEKSDNGVKMSNGEKKVTLLLDKETSLDKVVDNYQRLNPDYNITSYDAKIGDNQILVTNASKIDDNGTSSYIFKYWFEKDGSIYNIQSSKIDTLNEVANGIIGSIK